MKRLLILAALLAMIPAAAQNPSTTWPYLYGDFTPGVVYMNNGSKSELLLNVHVRRGRLHFIDKDIIKDADLTPVLVVTVGNDKYFPVAGELRKVVAENENGVVVVSQLGNFAALQETGGGYGVEVDGQVNQNHMLILQEKENGAELELITNYYLLRNGKCIKAARKDVEDALPDSAKAGWKAWLKANKIKWKDPQSLLKVVDYLSAANN